MQNNGFERGSETHYHVEANFKAKVIQICSSVETKLFQWALLFKGACPHYVFRGKKTTGRELGNKALVQWEKKTVHAGFVSMRT